MALRAAAAQLGRSQRGALQNLGAPGLTCLRGFASDEQAVSPERPWHPVQ